jgi:hypothetical protein
MPRLIISIASPHHTSSLIMQSRLITSKSVRLVVMRRAPWERSESDENVKAKVPQFVRREALNGECWPV